jgi:hypothetical protein
VYQLRCNCAAAAAVLWEALSYIRKARDHNAAEYAVRITHMDGRPGGEMELTLIALQFNIQWIIITANGLNHRTIPEDALPDMTTPYGILIFAGSHYNLIGLQLTGQSPRYIFWRQSPEYSDQTSMIYYAKELLRRQTDAFGLENFRRLYPAAELPNEWKHDLSKDERDAVIQRMQNGGRAMLSKLQEVLSQHKLFKQLVPVLPPPVALSLGQFLVSALPAVDSKSAEGHTRSPDERLHDLGRLLQRYEDVEFVEWDTAQYDQWIAELESGRNRVSVFRNLEATVQLLPPSAQIRAPLESAVERQIISDIAEPMCRFSNHILKVLSTSIKSAPSGGAAAGPSSASAAAHAAGDADDLHLHDIASQVPAAAPGVAPPVLSERWHALTEPVDTLNPPNLAAANVAHEYLARRWKLLRASSELKKQRESTSLFPDIPLLLLDANLVANEKEMDSFIEVKMRNALMAPPPAAKATRASQAELIQNGMQLIESTHGIATVAQLLHYCLLCRSFSHRRIAFGAVSCHSHTMIVRVTEVAGVAPRLPRIRVEFGRIIGASATGLQSARAALCRMVIAISHTLMRAAGSPPSPGFPPPSASPPFVPTQDDQASDEEPKDAEDRAVPPCGEFLAIAPGLAQSSYSLRQILFSASPDADEKVAAASDISSMWSNLERAGGGQCGDVVRVGQYALKMYDESHSTLEEEGAQRLLSAEARNYQLLSAVPGLPLAPLYYAGLVNIGDQQAPAVMTRYVGLDLERYLRQRKSRNRAAPDLECGGEVTALDCSTPANPCIRCRTLSCLRAVHAAGFVHGDPRPANFCWDEQQQRQRRRAVGRGNPTDHPEQAMQCL